MGLNARFVPRSKLLQSACFCSLILAFTATPRASAQEEDAQSVADAARAARARHAQATGDSAQNAALATKHSPFSQTQLLAWIIAGVSAPALLTDLQANGITFSPDNAHLATLKDAQLPPDLVAALPGVPSHPGASAPEPVPQALIAASQSFNSKDYSAARKLLETLTQQSPNADLFAALGNLYDLSRDLPSAKSSFERAVQLDPAFVYAHVRLAGVYYSLENGAQAGAEAKRALQLQPDNAQARKYLALSLSMKLQSANSAVSEGSDLEDLEDLQTKDGDDQEAKDLNNQGVALMNQREWLKAETAFKGAIALEPKVALWYYNLGNLYEKWGGYKDMERAAFLKAKALAPRNLAVRQNYGHFLCVGRDYNEAITEFREILKMDPDWNMARPCLYVSLFNSGRKNEAAQVLGEYSHWNQTHGVPDDSDEIDGTKPRNNYQGPAL